MTTTRFEYDTDLAQFVSDYCNTIDGAANDDSVDIASLYIESCLPAGIHPTDEELAAEVKRLIAQIDYYR